MRGVTAHFHQTSDAGLIELCVDPEDACPYCLAHFEHRTIAFQTAINTSETIWLPGVALLSILAKKAGLAAQTCVDENDHIRFQLALDLSVN